MASELFHSIRLTQYMSGETVASYTAFTKLSFSHTFDRILRCSTPLSKNFQRTFKELSKNFQRTFKELQRTSKYFQRTFKELQRTSKYFKELSKNFKENFHLLSLHSRRLIVLVIFFAGHIQHTFPLYRIHL